MHRPGKKLSGDAKGIGPWEGPFGHCQGTLEGIQHGNTVTCGGRWPCVAINYHISFQVGIRTEIAAIKKSVLPCFCCFPLVLGEF